MSSFKPRMFAKALNEFIASKNDFKIIYTPPKVPQPSLISQHTDRVCVLDSSFNPPHLGHYTLAIDSLNQTYSTHNEEKVLFLVLSVKNADKLQHTPASFEERIDMMCLMANDISDRYKVKVGVGLSKHAKFVDKSSSTLAYIKANYHLPLDHANLKLTFSVGFDTLIRIFNPKYYLPDKLSHSLNEFMEATDIFCLTRSDKDSTFQEQIKYLADIKLGKFQEIPEHWSSGIYLEKKHNDATTDISSSSIRKQVQEGKNEWEDEVIPEIKDYILQHQLYK